VAKKANRQDRADRLAGEVRLLVDRIQKLLRKLCSVLLQIISASSERPGVVRSNTNHWVQARDIVIKKHRRRDDKMICTLMDTELAQRDGPPLGLPEPWMEKYGVQTFSEAYENKTLCPPVQKMISDAKKRWINFL
jgi:hypothetical protein